MLKDYANWFLSFSSADIIQYNKRRISIAVCNSKNTFMRLCQYGIPTPQTWVNLLKRSMAHQNGTDTHFRRCFLLDVPYKKIIYDELLVSF